MELVSKEDGEHYTVATEFDDDSFCIVAKSMNSEGATSVLHYASIAAFLGDWEDAD